MLGRTTNQMLVELLDELERVGSALTQLSKTGLSGASIAILSAGESLLSKSRIIKSNLIDNSNLSKNTYTL
jgi:phage-related minor tail protein